MKETLNYYWLICMKKSNLNEILFSPDMGIVFLIFTFLIWFSIPRLNIIRFGFQRNINSQMLIHGLLFILFWFLGSITVKTLFLYKNKEKLLYTYDFFKIKKINTIYAIIGLSISLMMVLNILKMVGLGTLINSSGTKHAVYFNLYGHIPGLTIFIQFLPVCIILYSFRLLNKQSLKSWEKLIFIYFILFSLYRGLFLERTALLEIIIPLIIIYTTEKGINIKKRYLFLFLLLFFIIYITGEYFRSWELFGKELQIAEGPITWGLYRLYEYLNSVYHYYFALSNIDIDYAPGQNFFRFISDVLMDLDIKLKLTENYYNVYKSNYGFVGFTTMGVLGDYYLDLGICSIIYAYIQSIVMNIEYYRWRRRYPVERLIYPTIYLGSLFLWYVIYLNTNRAIGIIIALALVAKYSYKKSEC